MKRDKSEKYVVEQKKPRRTRCSYPGCRKLQIPGGKNCEAHKGSNGVSVVSESETPAEIHPLEAVTRMTEIERLNLVKVETECMNFILQIRNHDLETEEVKRRFTEQLQSRAAHRTQLMALAEAKKDEQQQVVKGITDKYELDPQHMTYDAETGVLHDMRPV